MDLKYQSLCTIAFKHAYYRDNTSRDFTLVPTATSLEQMQQFGLLAKTIRGKTTILQKMDGAVAETPFNDPICLSFTILLNNPLLLNVTETFGTRRFYLTNLASNGTLRSSLTEQAQLSQFDALSTIYPQRFSMNFPKGQFQGLAVKRVAPTQWLQNLPPLSINAEMETTLVNLTESGKYELTKLPNGTPEIRYANDEILNNPSFFGVLELFFDINSTPISYDITLQQRVFTWQYFLVDVKNKAVNFINPVNIKLTFTKSTKDNITPNGISFVHKNTQTMSADALKTVTDLKINNPNLVNDIYLFESDNNIPVLENRPPIVQLSLLSNPNVKPQLPIPDIENIKIRLPTPTATTANAMIFYNI